MKASKQICSAYKQICEFFLDMASSQHENMQKPKKKAPTKLNVIIQKCCLDLLKMPKKVKT